MMPVATFDTLKFANTLKAAGVPDKQAEAQAVAFAEVIQINLKDLVTKDDLAATAKDLRQEIRELEIRLNARFDTMSAEMKAERTMMKWMFTIMVTGIVGLLVRSFFFHTAM
jgi:G3E family GTPase